MALARAFVVAGDAWMRHGIAAVRVDATTRAGGEPLHLSFPASRDMVRYKGKVLYALGSWSAKVALPSDGQWEVHAVATDAAGGELSTPSRSLAVRAGAPAREFQSWRMEHLVPLGLILAGAIGLALFARSGWKPPDPIRAGTPRFNRVAVWLTAAVWANEFAYQLYWYLAGGWSVTNALMLQMCGLAILFLPVMLLAEGPRTRQFLFDVLYFWGIGGALQALIAPDIGANGFPAYRYFSFFLSHGLIITMAVVMAFAGGVRITTARSLLRAFVVTNILLVPVYGIDRVLQLIPPYDPGNYFVLGYPPPTGSIVDLFSEIFGPSPRYVIGLELMGLVVFTILYLPWPIAGWIGKRRAQGAAGRTAAVKHDRGMRG